jgi:hypothetical protein
MMCIAKVKCDCGKWIRLRTTQSQDSVLCWNCNRLVAIRIQGLNVAGFVQGKLLPAHRVDVELLEK